MTGSTPARRRAARANGRAGGRPRLFANGVRRVSTAVPEDDARLVDLLAVSAGKTASRVVAEAVWALLAAEGFTPTWGVPDAQRVSGNGAALPPSGSVSGNVTLDAGDETGSPTP